MEREKAENVLEALIGNIESQMKDRSWAPMIAISDVELEALREALAVMEGVDTLETFGVLKNNADEEGQKDEAGSTEH